MSRMEAPSYSSQEAAGSSANNMSRLVFLQSLYSDAAPGNQSFMDNSSMFVYELGNLAMCATWNGTGPCEILDINSTKYGNSTSESPAQYSTWLIVVLAFLAGATILITVIGNLVVVLSFVLERNIRNPTNYFIASLAMSDLLIGIFSMPFYTVYLLMGSHWYLGPLLCDLWLSLDYTVCMTSIYTVFCITIDRFCSVKIPAKYRNWRTPRKFSYIVAATWVIPTAVFFTSICGWQYFVGKRTIDENKCFVQYMEDPLFSILLQISYFWVTLTVMCVLYTGMYRVALNLQKRSAAKQKKMTSLVSMAGQTMTKIGIGMSQQQAGGGEDNNKGNANVQNQKLDYQTNANSSNGNSRKKVTSTTSFNKSEVCKEEERSSSPAYASDTDTPSSQSPQGVQQQQQQSKTDEIAPNYVRGNNLLVPGQKPNPDSAELIGNNISPPPPPPPGTNSCSSTPSTGFTPYDGQGDVFKFPEPPEHLSSNAPIPKQLSDQSTEHTLRSAAILNESPKNDVLATKNSPGELKHVNSPEQEAVESEPGKSGENLAFVNDGQHEPGEEVIFRDPDSPIWKKRASLIERENRRHAKAEPREPETVPGREKKEKRRKKGSKGSRKKVGKIKESLEANDCNERSTLAVSNPPGESGGSSKSPANVQVETEGSNKPVSKLAKPDEIQPLNSDETTSLRRSSSRSRTPQALRNIVDSVSTRKGKRSKTKRAESAQKSRSENRARKALRTITVILGAFVICWTPWHVLSMITSLCPKGCFPSILYDISYWLCYLNSPINPFCYALANPLFKKTFIRIIKFDWHRT